MAENTPKRRAQEPTKTSVRFENNVGDERQSTNQSPATIQEGSHPNESGSQGKIKRRLFSDFEADYRAVRNGKWCIFSGARPGFYTLAMVVY